MTNAIASAAPGDGAALGAALGEITLGGRPFRLVDLERRSVRHDAAIKALFRRG